MSAERAYRRLGIAVAWSVCVLLPGAQRTMAQGRGRVTIASPRNLQSVGTGATSSFRSYSYGAGSVGGSSKAGGNVLRRAIQITPQSSLRSVVINSAASPLRSNIGQSTRGLVGGRVGGGGAPITGSASAPPASRTIQRYRPSENLPSPAPGRTIPPLSGQGQSTGRRPLMPAGAAWAYLQASTAPPLTSPLAGSRTIESLAPDKPGLYRRTMLQGESAFRAGDYHQASARFELARSLQPRSPESVLSLFHARFATSRASYATAAYLLGRALRLMPDLPLAPLKPATFYGDADAYAERQADLKRYCDQRPADTGAWLVLAYFQWFDGDVQPAYQSLKHTQEVARDPNLIEAAAIFADAMAASDKLQAPDESRATAVNDADAPTEAPGSEAGPAGKSRPGD